MSGGSVGPLLIPANYVGCLSANQMTGTFLPCPSPTAAYSSATHQSSLLELWPQHCIVGHRNIAMQSQSSENIERRFFFMYQCWWYLSGVESAGFSKTQFWASSLHKGEYFSQKWILLHILCKREKTIWEHLLPDKNIHLCTNPSLFWTLVTSGSAEFLRAVTM